MEHHPAYDPLLLTKAAAKYIGSAPETLLKMAHGGEIAVVRRSEAKGSPMKFRLSALNAWIREHEMCSNRSQSG